MKFLRFLKVFLDKESAKWATAVVLVCIVGIGILSLVVDLGVILANSSHPGLGLSAYFAVLTWIVIYLLALAEK